MGLFIIVLLAIATVLLIRNMNAGCVGCPTGFRQQARRRPTRPGRCPQSTGPTDRDKRGRNHVRPVPIGHQQPPNG